jgi:hypothetical protein
VANTGGVRLLLCVGLVLVVAACGGTKTVTVTVTRTSTVVTTVTTGGGGTTSTTVASACAASHLSGSFDEVQGSAGAGQIAYRLSLKNTGSSACYVQGVPLQVLLLGTSGAALPTSPSAEPGQGPGARIVLQPSDSAGADARFSPDVPGTGDNQGAKCQPTATVLRVTIGGGTLDAPVQPPTSVCERGSLNFRPFTAS